MRRVAGLLFGVLIASWAGLATASAAYRAGAAPPAWLAWAVIGVAAFSAAGALLLFVISYADTAWRWMRGEFWSWLTARDVR